MTDAERAVREAHEAVESMRGWEENDDQRVSNAHATIDHAIEATENKFQVMGYEQGKREENEACAKVADRYPSSAHTRKSSGEVIADSIRARISKEGE